MRLLGYLWRGSLALRSRLGFAPWPLRDGRRQRRAWFSVIAAAALTYESFLLFAPRSATWRSPNEITIDLFGMSAQVSQGVTPDFDGWNGVTLSFHSRELFETAVRCELWRLEQPSQTWAPIYRWTEFVSGYGTVRHRLQFPTMADSRGRSYRLDLRRPPGRSIGLSLVASKENLMHGSLSVEGRDQWGDLAMRLHAANRYRTFLMRAKIPDFLKHPAVNLTLLALYNWALAAFAFYMVVEDDSETRA